MTKRKKELDQELKRILTLLKAKYRPEKVILFGSYARGKVKKWSDLDIAIIKKTKKRFIDRGVEILRLTRPKIAVDFFVYTPKEFAEMKKDNYFIRDEVVKGGKVIYEKAS